jgi:mono/diheme cytochrome c family protein
MKSFLLSGCFVLCFCVAVSAQTAPAEKPHKFPPKQIHAGAELFARNCSPCHGAHMADPEGAFDLRTFPHDQHSRFVNSVTNGKNSMPPWGGVLKPEDIEALWSYVVAGESNHTSDEKTKKPTDK